MMTSKRLLAVAISAALYAPLAAHATNGMNLEGYGAIATAMGGAGQAYDNGTAAVMNNPATLGLMGQGNRIDVALGALMPNVEANVNDGSGAGWESKSDVFYMPAFGWAQKRNQLTYGVGIFAQGGMGTEYNDQGGPFGASPGGAMVASDAQDTFNTLDGMATSFGLTHISANPSDAGDPTLIAPRVAADAVTLREFSEVSVGRLVFPLAYNVDDKLSIGGSIDYVWAGMDIQMAMGGADMGAMMAPGGSEGGIITGGLVTSMGGMFFDADPAGGFNNVGQLNPMNYGISGLNGGYFDFANSDDFTGKAQGAGFAGKIGFTYKASSRLTIGGSYHSKTAMGDLETTGAKVNMSVLMSALGTNDGTATGTPDGTLYTTDTNIEMVGKIKVKDFQWPATTSIGMSFQASDSLMLVADVKHIGWADVMESFTMQFTAQSITMGGQDVTAMFADPTMTAVLYQKWDDQIVLALGGAYKATNATTLRAGLNYSEQPIDSKYLHYLFPAVTETHVTFGVGHQFNEAQSVDFSLSYVPEKTVKFGTGPAEASMSQTNWQMMYSHRF